jgi:copper chaperone NosL
MIVVNHAGPKGQIILENRDEAFWFTSVRDTLAFTFLPEEPKNINAIYVTAMDNPGWDHPENEMDRWLLAQDAWYVIDSEKRGGMGQAEAIPFATQVAADKFAQQYGGRIVRHDEMPKDYILGKTP